MQKEPEERNQHEDRHRSEMVGVFILNFRRWSRYLPLRRGVMRLIFMQIGQLIRPKTVGSWRMVTRLK